MPKKILIISQYFLPDINAASYRIDDLYSALRKLNFDVTVVTTYPQKFAVEEVKEDSAIHRLVLSKVEKKSFINYIKNYFGFMFKSMFYSLFRLRKKKFDYIFVTSPPLFVALGGVLIAFLKRTKLILDIRDIWPDSAVAAGMLKQSGFLYRLTKWLETFIYKQADIITCVSAPMKRNIYEKSKHQQIHILYNGVSPNSLKQDEPKLPKQESEIITVGYAGNIGIVQNVDVLIETAKKLQNSKASSFEFLIIGDGVERKRLEIKANELGLDRVQFTGAMSKRETEKQLSQVDILFFSLVDNPIFETTIPSKLFDYLLRNKPIVTSIKGEGRDILEELGCALFFDASSSRSLEEALYTYQENKAWYDDASLKNKHFVSEQFNREETFIHFLKKLK
ncbi:MAG TPA: glycosyltransferase family 4 protein [Pseudogracilibacillus sp.]|nr:glycosyltransferase family 4 protein [Pseudogracilibacillus sp.]